MFNNIEYHTMLCQFISIQFFNLIGFEPNFVLIWSQNQIV